GGSVSTGSKGQRTQTGPDPASSDQSPPMPAVDAGVFPEPATTAPAPTTSPAPLPTTQPVPIPTTMPAPMPTTSPAPAAPPPRALDASYGLADAALTCASDGEPVFALLTQAEIRAWLTRPWVLCGTTSVFGTQGDV